MAIDIRKRIIQLNRLDTDKAEYEYIKTVIGEMQKSSSVVIQNSGLSGYLFRVRINPKTKPASATELREPSTEDTRVFQRCNPPGQPLFYSANRRITAILECYPKEGDLLYLGQWRVDKRFALNSILRPDLLGDDVNHTQRDEQLINYYDTLFTRPIHSINSSQYKITAAITDRLTRGFPPGGYDGYEMSALGNVGLSYPSVVDIEDGHNMVLYPEMVDECLNLAHVMEARVISNIDNEVRIEVTDNSNLIEDGLITWSGDPTAVPFNRDGNNTRYVSDGTRWRLGVRKESIEEKELVALLQE